MKQDIFIISYYLEPDLITLLYRICTIQRYFQNRHFHFLFRCICLFGSAVLYISASYEMNNNTYFCEFDWLLVYVSNGIINCDIIKVAVINKSIFLYCQALIYALSLNHYIYPISDIALCVYVLICLNHRLG